MNALALEINQKQKTGMACICIRVYGTHHLAIARGRALFARWRSALLCTFTLLNDRTQARALLFSRVGRPDITLLLS